MGAGSLIAALSIAAMGKAPFRVMIGAASMFCVLLAGIGLSTSFELTAALLLLFGMVSLVFSTTINTTIQLSVPDELRGRVMSIFFLLMAGSTPIGGLITGQIADRFSVRDALLVEAACCAIGVGVALAYGRIARVRSSDAQQTVAGNTPVTASR
jgi:MFS family permease